ATSLQKKDARLVGTLFSQKKSLAQIVQPMIFVHGVNQDANDVGKSAFGPIYSSLRKAFGTESLRTFFYVDDKAYADNGSCPARYSPCISQSAILDNAVALAK